jgi:radical SAM superfamily enzyme YgiQ (UPF0313 family)
VSRNLTLISSTLGEDGKTEPPLGPLYIAAVLREAGVNIDFRDFQLHPGAHGFSGDALAAFCTDHSEILAFSCFVDMLPAVIAASETLHAARPETRIILGGPGPSATAIRILEAYPFVEAVVQGEGEETVVEWIKTLDDGSCDPVAGMAYRRDGKIISGPPRDRRRDLDNLPLPAYDLLNWTQYTHARVITTRGCSYKCSFCDVTALWGNRSVYRGLESTISEMEMLRDVYGKTSIAIVDDTFVLNRKRVTAFCKSLIARNSAIEWGCFARINLMDEELASLMARSGCRALFYGIDSGSPKVLEKVIKVVRAEDIMPVLEMSAKYFEKIEASFIWGYPFESLEDFLLTVELAGAASSLAPTVNVQMHMLSPLPLAPIYHDFKGDLIPPEPEDRDWLLLPALLLDSKATKLKQMVEQHPDIFPGFYTFPTPEKAEKRAVLRRSMRALDRTIGRSVFDPSVATLLTSEDRGAEEGLLAEEREAPERIGVGLALGMFKRARRRAAYAAGSLATEGTRGAFLVRQRSEHG